MVIQVFASLDQVPILLFFVFLALSMVFLQSITVEQNTIWIFFGTNPGSHNISKEFH